MAAGKRRELLLKIRKINRFWDAPQLSLLEFLMTIFLSFSQLASYLYRNVGRRTVGPP